MKNADIKNFLKGDAIGKYYIYIVSFVLIYLIISLYFINHYFFNTVINGVNVSLKAHEDVHNLIGSYVSDFKLQIIESDKDIEEIIGKNIEMKYNEKNSINKIYEMQNSLKWIKSLLSNQEYYVDDLFVYNEEYLENYIKELKCFKKDIIESQNASFRYSNGSFETVKEVYGNRINKEKLDDTIKVSILSGKRKLDLNESHCYEVPRYTVSSDKTIETLGLLNKSLDAKINYIFGCENEILDRNIINKWLTVDDDLNVVIDKKAVSEYIKTLSKKYDTVGITRKINTSTNKTVEVKGGFYGWKINCYSETRALIENIKLGEIIQKEPIYAQKGQCRDEDDIGNTYIEINITRQHLWFYKDGEVIAQGDVVTGNPNRGNSTKLGVYMLNYKEMGSTLNGPNYEADVTYWMPFNGNIGIHDASWRYSFGGEIYKRNGTHGCVNAPIYLAKKIFENIEDGTPIICYEE